MAVISKELYYLVNSMTSTEKAYFKKFGFKYQKEGDKSEYVLFDIINSFLKKNEIDNTINDVVAKKFNIKQPNKDIVSVKNTLFQSLVKSLTEYDSKKDSRYNAIIQFMEAKTLLKRNATKSAAKIAKKINASIVKNEDFLLQLLFTEIDMAIGIVTNDKAKIDSSNETLQQALHLFQKNTEVKRLYEKIYNIHRTLGRGNKTEIVELISPHRIKFESLKPKDTDPLKFRFNYYSIGKLIGFIVNDMKYMLSNMIKSIQIIKEAPDFFVKRKRYVLASYADLICHGLEFIGLEYYSNYIASFEEIEVENPEDQRYKDALAFKIKSTYLLAQGNFDAFSELKEELVQTSSKLDFNNLMAIYDDFIVAFYSAKKYKEAIHFIYDQFEIVRKEGKRFDLYMNSELLLLAIHYQLGDYEVLTSLIKSFERRMKNNDNYSLEEKIIVKFFKNVLTKEFGKEKEMAASTRVLLEKNGYQKTKLQFNFLRWFKSIEKRKDYLQVN